MRHRVISRLFRAVAAMAEAELPPPDDAERGIDVKVRPSPIGTRRVAAGASAMVSILAALALSCAFPAQAASFDCAKAATAVEKTICADAELSRLDEELARAYAQALAEAADRQAVKSGQRTWLRNTRDVCADAMCLKAGYEARIVVLAQGSGTPAGAAGSAGENRTQGAPPAYRITENYDAGICEPLLDSLNSDGLYRRPIGNKFITQPWERREYQIRNRSGALEVSSWQAAFLDINTDGDEDAIYRFGSSIKGRDYQELYVDLSIDPEVKAADPMPEDYVRGVLEGPGPDIRRYSPYLRYVEIVSLQGRFFLIDGYWIDFWTEGRPNNNWAQVLRLSGGEVARICFFR